jgi:hypothetical protein
MFHSLLKNHLFRLNLKSLMYRSNLKFLKNRLFHLNLKFLMYLKFLKCH